MARKRSKNPIARLAWPLLLVSVVATGALAHYVLNSPKTPVEPPPSVRQKLADKAATPRESVRVPTPIYQDDTLRFKSETRKTTAGVDPRVEAVNAFLAQVKAVPRDARLVSVKVSNGTATLDFTDAFRQTYGTEDEQVVLNGLLETLKQFEEIRYVRLTAGGEPIDSLGNVDLTEVQPVPRGR